MIDAVAAIGHENADPCHHRRGATAMETARNRRLQRLVSCLQTILALEPRLTDLELDEPLREEFLLLKRFLKRTSSMDVAEEDVSRIESATANLLDELRLPLALQAHHGAPQPFLQ